MAKRKTPSTPPHGFDFDRAEAAGYLGETVSALAEWASHRPAKYLSYVIAGGKAWYRRADCDALLRAKTRKARAA